MNIVITGGGGFLGQKLARALLDKGQLLDDDGQLQPIDRLTLFDLTEPALPPDPRLLLRSGDISDAPTIQTLIGMDTDVIFHLAAVVSGEAEQHFQLGMRVNLEATRLLLEHCRLLPEPPKLIFTSSVAVFGGQMPSVLQDDTAPTPQSSYGTQKAIGELLINDYSRRGFVDGRVVRLPTIVVRPGKPNQATSTFASSIIRQPLQGQPATCPVSPALEMWLMSPRRAVQSLVYAAELPSIAWEPYRAVSLPGLTVSVQEMIECLRQIAGNSVADRIILERDALIERIVGSWPSRFNTARALKMGFEADSSMVEIIQAFIDDELGGKFVA